MCVPPKNIQLVKTIPGVSETYLQKFKHSEVLVKKAHNSGKPVSQLTKYPDGRYRFVEFKDGKPNFGIENDPEIGARHYFKIGKRGVKTKEKTLYNGLKGFCEWYMDIYNEAGQRIKQIITR